MSDFYPISKSYKRTKDKKNIKAFVHITESRTYIFRLLRQPSATETQSYFHDIFVIRLTIISNTFDLLGINEDLPRWNALNTKFGTKLFLEHISIDNGLYHETFMGIPFKGLNQSWDLVASVLKYNCRRLLTPSWNSCLSNELLDSCKQNACARLCAVRISRQFEICC